MAAVRNGTWEPVTSRGRLVYWRRILADGGWLAVTRDGNRWIWTRRSPHLPVGMVWDSGHRSTSALARIAADRAVADPDRYGPTDTCATCGVEARECGHRTAETPDLVKR